MRGDMAVQVTIYLNEADQWHHKPLHIEMLNYLRKEGVFAATATHTVAGFLGRHRVETAHLADVGGRLCGFVSCTGDGHIDLLYTAPEQARRGVASLLLQHAEAHMRACGAAAFHTEASLVAQPFFARHGYVVVEEQFVQRQGVGFRRYAMRKVCAAPLSEQAAQRSSRASAAWIS